MKKRKDGERKNERKVAQVHEIRLRSTGIDRGNSYAESFSNLPRAIASPDDFFGRARPAGLRVAGRVLVSACRFTV
jgi:hypothetical protein